MQGQALTEPPKQPDSVVEHMAEVLRLVRDEGPKPKLTYSKLAGFAVANYEAALTQTEPKPADGVHPVMAEIFAEVEKATRKFPTWPTRIIDAGNVVSEEAGELAKACLQVTYEKHKETLEGVRMEAIQTAAMAFRFLCSMDRYDCEPGEQHAQDPLDTLTERNPDNG